MAIRNEDIYNDPCKDELLDGKIVMMAPSPNVIHASVSRNITRIFGNYLMWKSCAYYHELDVHFSEKDRTVPDGMVVCNKDIIKDNGIHGAPDLIIEILSPATSKRDKGYKKDLYERHGVKEYWIVDVRLCTIEVYILHNDRYKLDEIYTHYHDYELEEMTDEEKAAVVTEFKTSIFDDLIIPVNEVFWRV